MEKIHLQEPADNAPMIEWALYYASMGIAVFPIRPRTKDGYYRYDDYLGKPSKSNPQGTPYSWQAQASADPERVKRFWTDHPDANIGGAMGRVSGCLYVLDFDMEHVAKDPKTGKEYLVRDGKERLREWEQETGLKINEDTAIATTGSGGQQYFFMADPEKLPGGGGGASHIFEKDAGNDTRGDGNYCVLPPSTHPNGKRYEWDLSPEEYPPAVADQAFYEYWKGKRSTGEGRKAPGFDELKGVTSGRHDALKSYMAGVIAKTGGKLSPEEYEALLEMANNALPIPIGQGADDKADEYEKTVAPMVNNLLAKENEKEEIDWRAAMREWGKLHPGEKFDGNNWEAVKEVWMAAGRPSFKKSDTGADQGSTEAPQAQSTKEDGQAPAETPKTPQKGAETSEAVAILQQIDILRSEDELEARNTAMITLSDMVEGIRDDADLLLTNDILGAIDAMKKAKNFAQYNSARRDLGKLIKIATKRREKTTGEAPGLMDREKVIDLFENANDAYITIHGFPQFSKAAKIKQHSSVVLAADTGVGKSSLAINFLNALNEEYPCMYFNLEMDQLTVLRRLVSIYSGLELDRVEGYKNDAQTAAAVNTHIRTITGRQPLQIIQGAYTLEAIEEDIKNSTQGREKTTIVFIDHSLLVDTERQTASRYDRFTRVSEGLRKIALKYNVILFVLLQQSRSGKADDTERPQNSSLKESGSWENDATSIIFLWYDPVAKRKKLIITKNRFGELGEYTLNYWKKTQTYAEAKDQASTVSNKPVRTKTSRRDKQREKLQKAIEDATVMTNGRPTLQAMADAADVTTATIKGWIKEYGGCTIDGKQIDPAGSDTEINFDGFVRLLPSDEDAPFNENQPKNVASVRR